MVYDQGSRVNGVKGLWFRIKGLWFMIKGQGSMV